MFYLGCKMHDRSDLNSQKDAPGAFGILLLAGGRSRRMGCDKAQLSYHGRPLIEHMQRRLDAMGPARLVIGGRLPGLRDLVPDGGPVASICALAQNLALSGGLEQWLIVPVDMPLLAPDLLFRLLSDPAPAAYFIAHPLPAALRLDNDVKAFLKVAARDLKAGRGVPVKRLLAAVKASAVMPTAEEVGKLLNINTPEEWAALLSREEGINTQGRR